MLNLAYQWEEDQLRGGILLFLFCSSIFGAFPSKREDKKIRESLASTHLRKRPSEEGEREREKRERKNFPRCGSIRHSKRAVPPPEEEEFCAKVPFAPSAAKGAMTYDLAPHYVGRSVGRPPDARVIPRRRLRFWQMNIHDPDWRRNSPPPPRDKSPPSFSSFFFQAIKLKWNERN